MTTYDGVPVKIVTRNERERGAGNCPETYRLLKESLK